MKKNILILHNIRSNHNVGSLFRTADAAGIEEIILSGYTPTPLDRFGREVKEIYKTALGAEKTISWKKMTFKKAIEFAQRQKLKVVAIEQDKSATDYKKIKIKNGVAFVLGNEVNGISKKELKFCDAIVEIPMKGGKESLNVAVAGGIAIFRILNI